MKKQTEYSRMKEKVGMHDYMKGRKAGMEYAGKEPYKMHPEHRKMKKDYPMHADEMM